MRKLRPFLGLMLVAVMVVAMVRLCRTSAHRASRATSHRPRQSSQPRRPPDKTIVVVATEAGNARRLVAALKAANLVETLEGAGPFTVFAPDDAAFGSFPPAPWTHCSRIRRVT